MVVLFKLRFISVNPNFTRTHILSEVSPWLEKNYVTWDAQRRHQMSNTSVLLCYIHSIHVYAKLFPRAIPFSILFVVKTGKRLKIMGVYITDNIFCGKSVDLTNILRKVIHCGFFWYNKIVLVAKGDERIRKMLIIVCDKWQKLLCLYDFSLNFTIMSKQLT